MYVTGRKELRRKQYFSYALAGSGWKEYCSYIQTSIEQILSTLFISVHQCAITGCTGTLQPITQHFHNTGVQAQNLKNIDNIEMYYNH